jgi:hypothetical protein
MRTALGDAPMTFTALAGVWRLPMCSGHVCGTMCGCRRLPWWSRLRMGILRRKVLGGRLWRLLHWEKRSAGQCQCDAIYEVRVRERTLGGIRVERPRFWMKLILTAVWRPISINCPLGGCHSIRETHLGWQDDGGEMGVDGEVVQEAASFCRRPPSPADPSFNHHRHRRHQRLGTQHPARHVCPAPFNSIQSPRTRPAASRREGSCPPIPRVRDQA